jgi:hypothetical protein
MLKKLIAITTLLLVIGLTALAPGYAASEEECASGTPHSAQLSSLDKCAVNPPGEIDTASVLRAIGLSFAFVVACSYMVLKP